jgi:hypothetical protein
VPLQNKKRREQKIEDRNDKPAPLRSREMGEDGQSREGKGLAGLLLGKAVAVTLSAC